MEPLLWLVLEAGVALGLLVLIVWWTWPRNEPRAGRDGIETPHRRGRKEDQ